MTRIAIKAIAAGGDGVGHLPDGRAVFVPRAAPGDSVEIAIREQKRRFARGRLTEVVEASPDRVDPPCRHYVVDRCGGCQLQHLVYDAQLAAKSRIAGDALRRLGRREVADPPVLPAPAQWRYRTRLTLAARQSGGVSGPLLGLHQEGAPGRVFPLVDCLITAPPLMEAWEAIRPAASHLPSGVEGLVLRLDREGHVHAIVLGGTPPWNPGPLFDAIGRPDLSLWWRPDGGAARVLAGPHRGFPALAFEQVNPALADRMRDRAVTSLGDVRGITVWDLYGGVGDTARLLAAAGARVWSVDADRNAVAWAESRPVPTDTAPIVYVAGRVEEVLHRLTPPDAIIMNPPRTGLHERVAARLNEWAAERGPRARGAYISCDPATLARDLQRMSSLRIRDISAFDLFPQTAHVEVLCVLEGAEPGGGGVP